MPKKFTHKECFESYGTKPKNLRWSWSGRSPDGKSVSVTLWQDRFENGVDLYRSATHADDEKWFGSPGHNELIENLEWAERECGGEVSVIIAIAKDKDASPRSIRECFPKPELRMRVAYLDLNSKDFILERIV